MKKDLTFLTKVFSVVVLMSFVLILSVSAEDVDDPVLAETEESSKVLLVNEEPVLEPEESFEVTDEDLEITEVLGVMDVQGGSAVPNYNPPCSDLGFNFEYKAEDGNLISGKHYNDKIDITLYDNDESEPISFDWSSVFDVYTVIAKGGTGANVYNYSGSRGDLGLISPTNPNTNKPYGLSHITFCWNEPIVEPILCNLTLVSDTADFVEQKSAFAKLVTHIHSAWTAVIDGANWIWGDYPVVDPVGETIQTFVKRFNWTGSSPQAILDIASDNSYVVELNGDEIGADPSENNHALLTQDQISDFSILPGLNELKITVRNWPQAGGTTQTNPAGLMYKLSIDGIGQSCGYEVPYQVEPEGDNSGLLICKIIVNEEGQIITGSELDTQFSIKITKPDQTTQTVTFNTPLQLTHNLFNDNGEDPDAKCYLLDNLYAGQYLYDAEIISGEGDWEAPLYHDYFTKTPTSISDFSELTVDGAPDDNDDADGVMNLGKNHQRNLVIVNRLKEIEVPPHSCVINLEMIENGDFEIPVISSPWSFFPESTAGLSWLVDWVLPSQTPEIANLEFQRYYRGWLPYSGDQYAELDTHGAGTNEASVKIYQELKTVPGEKYSVSFAFSARPETGESDNRLNVYWGDSLMNTLTASGIGKDNTDWKVYKYVFTATDYFTKFALSDAGVSNTRGTFVDDVSVMCGEYNEEIYPYGLITYPVKDHDVKSGETTLMAEYYDGNDDLVVDVQWAVRFGTCEPNTGTVMGNVDGFSDEADWDGQDFSFTFDADQLKPGDYCFVFNPKDVGSIDVRETRWFTIEEKEELENQKPVITLIGDQTMTITEGDSFVDPGATASDPEDGDITDDIITTGLVDPNTPGTYYLYYNVSNSKVLAADEVIRTIIVEEKDEEGGNGNGDDNNNQITQSRRSSSSGGRRVVVVQPQGEVLGATTEAGTCGMYLHTYMRQDLQNDPWEVKKLQAFLNAKGYLVPITGVFDSETDRVVRTFQADLNVRILVPWQLINLSDGETPTGYVYKTTRHTINNIVCPGSEPFPQLP